MHRLVDLLERLRCSPGYGSRFVVGNAFEDIADALFANFTEGRDSGNTQLFVWFAPEQAFSPSDADQVRDRAIGADLAEGPDRVFLELKGPWIPAGLPQQLAQGRDGTRRPDRPQ